MYARYPQILTKQQNLLLIVRGRKRASLRLKAKVFIDL